MINWIFIKILGGCKNHKLYARREILSRRHFERLSRICSPRGRNLSFSIKEINGISNFTRVPFRAVRFCLCLYIDKNSTYNMVRFDETLASVRWQSKTTYVSRNTLVYRVMVHARYGRIVEFFKNIIFIRWKRTVVKNCSLVALNRRNGRESNKSARTCAPIHFNVLHVYCLLFTFHDLFTFDNT